MYKKIKRDENGNLWYQYELNGMPFRWVEVKPVPYAQSHQEYEKLQIRDEAGVVPMNALMKRWADKKGPSLPLDDLARLFEFGAKPFGYNVHHVVPRSLGGQADDLDNIVLMKIGLHEKLHDYFKESELHAWLEDFYADPANADKKVFLSIPILPPVVKLKDIPYVYNKGVKKQERERREDVIMTYMKSRKSHYTASIKALKMMWRDNQFLCEKDQKTQWRKNYFLCKRLKEQKALEAEYILGHPDLQEKTKLCRWNQKHAYLYQHQNEGRNV